MGSHDDEEAFYDWEDLENLPEDALTELENNAIQFTQALLPARPIAPSSDYGDEFDDDDLDDNVVIDESKSTPALNPTFLPQRPSPHINRETFPQRPVPSHKSNSVVGQRPRPPPPPPPPRFGQSQRPRQPSQGGPVGESIDARSQEPDPGLESLQRQIEELTRERNALRDDVNLKAGEIAIVRSKQEKASKEHERELASVRKQNADAIARQAREIEAARISERSAATERDFYKQDAAEALRSHRANQGKEQRKRDTTATPKKNKLLAHRDGFDDDEIEFLSPSKNTPSKPRKTNSPIKGAKRKRKNAESPAMPLEVVDPVGVLVEEPKLPVLDEAMLKKLSIQDDRFDFLGTILNHRIDSNHKKTIEELSKYALPTAADESLQSIILGRIPMLGRKCVNDLPLEFCELVVSIWSKCMAEKYFSPIYLLVDVLTLALELKTSSIAPHLIDSIVPLAQQLMEPIIVERFVKNKPPDKSYDKNTGSTSCLSLLYITALGCMCETQHIIRFWKYMRFDLTMIILTPDQLMADTELMIKLLSTSIFRDRFGAPAPDEAQDRAIFTNILDKLTHLLVEVPHKPRSEESLEPDVISKLRLQILQLMTSMTRSPFASKFMAMHRDLIGRIVKLASDELDELYDYKPGREESARIVSLAIRLLYFLVTKHDDVINMQRKLSVIPGGYQKYLLCLARLNYFEDDLVLESGIDPDVATCALELLEMVVTPEEGDAIHIAFTSQ